MSAIGDEGLATATAGGRRLAPAGWVAAWGPVMVWAAFILSLSGDRFSDVHTEAWLSDIASALGISLPVVEVANFIVRKSAHFVEYAVLSVLTLRAMLVTWPQRRRRQLLVWAVLAAAVWASIDELHQYYFTLARMGTPKDVVLDTTGAVAGAVMGASYLSRRARRSTA